MDAFFLQHFSRFDAFPGGGNLDQNAVVADARIVVEANQFAAFFNGGFSVEAQAGIHLRGHSARHDLEDLLSEDHADLIQGFTHDLLNRSVFAHQMA